MSFYVEKKDGKLSFNDLGGYEVRNLSTFWCIKEADKIFNWSSFDPILINTDDVNEKNDTYSYSKPNGSFYKLIPDFNFHSWPRVGIHDYQDTIDHLSENGKIPAEVNKVGWIGATGIPIRKQLILQTQNFKNIFDVQSIDWKPINENRTLTAHNYLSLPELVKKYSMLIDIEGAGYSGRLKYLLWSRRPVLLVDRPYKEYFFEHLKEWVHYIPVKRDLSDLVVNTIWCLNNTDKSRKIAENAYLFAETYLSRKACFAKWNSIISSCVSTKQYLLSQNIGGFLQCYKNPYATYKCLESFRKFYPEGTIVLLSDNAYDYSEMAKLFHCIYIHSRESIPLECIKLPEEKSQINHMKKLLDRISNAFRLCKETYVMWLEDDVSINHKITDIFKYDVNGWCPNRVLPINLENMAPDYPLLDKQKIYNVAGQGGTVFHKENILKYMNNKDVLYPLLENYNRYRCPWNQDFLISLLTILNNGTIGPYNGHIDGYGGIDMNIAVQHQFKEYYGVDLPPDLAHLIK